MKRARVVRNTLIVFGSILGFVLFLLVLVTFTGGRLRSPFSAPPTPRPTEVFSRPFATEVPARTARTPTSTPTPFPTRVPPVVLLVQPRELLAAYRANRLVAD